jgi:hypothetical protein
MALVAVGTFFARATAAIIVSQSGNAGKKGPVSIRTRSLPLSQAVPEVTPPA